VLLSLPTGNVRAGGIRPSTSTAAQPNVTQLEAQIAALQQQLTQTLQAQQGASQNIVQVEQQLAQTQSQLSADRITLDQINQQLAITDAQARRAQATVNRARKQLAALVQYQYELNSGGSSNLGDVLASKSFTQALNELDNLRSVADSTKTLTNLVIENLNKIRILQAKQQADQQKAQAVVNQLTQLNAQEQSQQAAYNQQVVTLSGNAATLNNQIEQLAGQVTTILGGPEGAAELAAALATGQTVIVGGGLPPFSFGPKNDPFPWGQCTWYVATQRNVSWSGDAWQWAGAAAAAGLPEGSLPEVGAIVVWGPGNGYSDVGHVAYVDAVQSPTSFTIDEANYQGLGIVDRRQINTLSDVETFIYGA
jgi:surface antigen/peptidoglycan hydrolase CwlO-like protein